ncbi:DEAD/DEAH box helicase [Candidatus Sumerlaeota bacterium]|nr:DEAD/DEAH box helicase [Candidatus Sumerlaeota bacterium]
MTPDLPLIVQSDRTMLLDADHPAFEEARDALAGFAELITSPEHYHTYRISPLSLWNAASSGLSADAIVGTLKKFSRYTIPENILYEIKDQVGRYGKLRLVKDGEKLVLESDDEMLITQFLADGKVKDLLGKRLAPKRVLVKEGNRGALKQALIRKDFPVEDLSGYVDGKPLEIAWRSGCKSGAEFYLRKYQRDAIDVFHAGGSARGGSGVLVLPCGAGKTIIGIGVIERVKQHTLVLTTSVTAVHQWRDELLDKTSITADQIGEYSGESKEIRPITVATYQILTYHKGKDEEFVHMDLFDKHEWGLIIYDEVHLLPAPVFRAVADLQARRRLGLTATLVREDGKETDVFSLIGPKKMDVPWKVLEKQGWIAQALCTEVRVGLPEKDRMTYAIADAKAKFRLASENEAKIHAAREIIRLHPDDQVMIIGQYLDQLEIMAKEFKAPIITGKTPNEEREAIYAAFKEGKIKLIIVSKVANFAVDLPSASVAIQISGTFGSRQEEAQRLGRVLRPKHDGKLAHFYTLVTEDSREREFASKRQLFLTEQVASRSPAGNRRVLGDPSR